MLKVTKILFGIVLSCSILTSQKAEAGDGKDSSGTKIDQIVKELVAAKGNLNQCYDSKMNKNDSGIPILIWAVSSKNLEAIKTLLDNGANPNIETMKGSSETALFEVSDSMDIEPDAKIREERRLKTREICETLIKAKADVNYKNKLGGTPIYKAATRGREDICAILIANSADVNAQDRLGNAPLHQAAMYGYWKAVELLIKNKADASVANKLKKTPLQLANERRDEKDQKEMRQKMGNSYYADADYDKTIEVLKKAGSR